jgi:hypothetical protein
MATVDSKEWARSVLSALGAMSFETCLDDGHTVDFAGGGPAATAIAGVVLETTATVTIDETPYSVIACHGLTREELDYAQEMGGPAIIDRLKEAGIYPRTMINRRTMRLDA